MGKWHENGGLFKESELAEDVDIIFSHLRLGLASGLDMK